jgi:hypothetical protein
MLTATAARVNGTELLNKSRGVIRKLCGMPAMALLTLVPVT